MVWTLTSFSKLKTKSFINNSVTKNSTKPFVKSLRKLNKTIIEYLFAFYKVGLRPYFGNACKFHPSCSSYAHEAFKKHNLVKATYLSTYRLLRCHPFCEGGLDPVPEKKKEVLNG